MILWSIENFRPRGELNSKVPNDPTLGQLGVPQALLDPEAYRFSGTLNCPSNWYRPPVSVASGTVLFLPSWWASVYLPSKIRRRISGRVLSACGLSQSLGPPDQSVSSLRPIRSVVTPRKPCRPGGRCPPAPPRSIL